MTDTPTEPARWTVEDQFFVVNDDEDWQAVVIDNDGDHYASGAEIVCAALNASAVSPEAQAVIDAAPADGPYGDLTDPDPDKPMYPPWAFPTCPVCGEGMTCADCTSVTAAPAVSPEAQAVIDAAVAENLAEWAWPSWAPQRVVATQDRRNAVGLYLASIDTETTTDE